MWSPTNYGYKPPPHSRFKLGQRREGAGFLLRHTLHCRESGDIVYSNRPPLDGE
jgi:hypothetical protein